MELDTHLIQKNDKLFYLIKRKKAIEAIPHNSYLYKFYLFKAFFVKPIS